MPGGMGRCIEDAEGMKKKPRELRGFLCPRGANCRLNRPKAISDACFRRNTRFAIMARRSKGEAIACRIVWSPHDV